MKVPDMPQVAKHRIEHRTGEPRRLMALLSIIQNYVDAENHRAYLIGQRISMDNVEHEDWDEAQYLITKTRAIMVIALTEATK